MTWDDVNRETDTCLACGKPIVLVNFDKLRGVVGMTMAWYHVTMFGNIKRWGHRPIPSSEYGRSPR